MQGTNSSPRVALFTLPPLPGSFRCAWSAFTLKLCPLMSQTTSTSPDSGSFPHDSQRSCLNRQRAVQTCVVVFFLPTVVSRSRVHRWSNFSPFPLLYTPVYSSEERFFRTSERFCLNALCSLFNHLTPIFFLSFVHPPSVDLSFFISQKQRKTTYLHEPFG